MEIMKIKEWMLINLREVAESLEHAIQSIQNDDKYGFEANVAMTYRKLNLATNTRSLSAKELPVVIKNQMEEYCRFPMDLGKLIADYE